MNWAAALGTGFGLGLAYFGGLWVAVRRLPDGGGVRFAVGRLARFGLAAVVFLALVKAGGVAAVAFGLIGLWGARWYFVRRLGRANRGR